MCSIWHIFLPFYAGLMKPDAIETKVREIRQKDTLLKHQCLNYSWKICAANGEKTLNIHSTNLCVEHMWWQRNENKATNMIVQWSLRIVLHGLYRNIYAYEHPLCMLMSELTFQLHVSKHLHLREIFGILVVTGRTCSPEMRKTKQL